MREVTEVHLPMTLQFSSDVKFLVTERHYTSTPAQRAAQPVVDAFNTSQLYANTFSHVQVGPWQLEKSVEQHLCMCLLARGALEMLAEACTAGMEQSTVQQSYTS